MRGEGGGRDRYEMGVGVEEEGKEGDLVIPPPPPSPFRRKG